jgi:hypothetical protein
MQLSIARLTKGSLIITNSAHVTSGVLGRQRRTSCLAAGADRSPPRPQRGKPTVNSADGATIAGCAVLVLGNAV